jgi:glucose/arabinose dehydrogenase
VDDPSIRLRAQDLDNDIGKTLRIADDGGIPADNPFVDQAGANPQIFTYGHRNGYDLYFHPLTGDLWQVEIGPMGGDEVNILLPGHNYGWPLVSTGRNYSGSLVSDQPWARPGMDHPRFHWVPSISPSSAISRRVPTATFISRPSRVSAGRTRTAWCSGSSRCSPRMKPPRLPSRCPL